MYKNSKEKISVQYEELPREDLVVALQLAEARDESMRPKKVAIPSAEMERIKDVLRVFGPYIENHYYFDILVSSKFGVIRIDIEGEYSFFYDADSLFLELVDEIFDDVRESGIVQEHKDITMLPQEESELRHRVFPLIGQLRDAEHYRMMFEAYIEEKTECKEE